MNSPYCRVAPDVNLYYSPALHWMCHAGFVQAVGYEDLAGIHQLRPVYRSFGTIFCRAGRAFFFRHNAFGQMDETDNGRFFLSAGFEERGVEKVITEIRTGII